MKNNSKLCLILTTICIVCAMVGVAALVVAIFDDRTEFESIFTYGISFPLGGFLSSFIISGLFYYLSVKKEMANVIEKTTKNVENELNNKFNHERELLNSVHKKLTESFLNRYRVQLVTQLKNDMAEIWDIKPGLINADDKYLELYKKLHDRSDEILNDVIKTIKI